MDEVIFGKKKPALTPVINAENENSKKVAKANAIKELLSELGIGDTDSPVIKFPVRPIVVPKEVAPVIPKPESVDEKPATKSEAVKPQVEEKLPAKPKPTVDEIREKPKTAAPKLKVLKPVAPPEEKEETEEKPDKVKPPAKTAIIEPEPLMTPEEEAIAAEEAEEIQHLRSQRIAIKEISKTSIKFKSPQEHAGENSIIYPPVEPNYPDRPWGELQSMGVEIPMNMVVIPDGDFLYGFAKTQRSLPVFFMDQFPVTCKQYQEFCVATNHPRPWNWGYGNYLHGKDNHPVTFVTHNDARAYAKWVDKRLPTEMEWEKAAGGEDGRLYPWGDEFDPNKCLCKNIVAEKHTKPTDFYPEGKSPYECFDMAGNAAEWAEPEYDEENPEKLAVIRGGSLRDGKEIVSCRTRIFITEPGFSSYFIGFRCVKDIKILE